MKPHIRHRRLYAFYNSKVLNALMIVVAESLLLMPCIEPVVLPVISASLALLLFIAYTLWLWIKKPARIVIDTNLSAASTWFVIYFLLVSAIDATNIWWYILPTACAVILLFLHLTRPHSRPFTI